MARRMFSPKIVSSDAFLDMPISTQALYFHLGMEADDDGFVNPKKTMRMIGVSDDDLKVLISKRFVLPFENGVVVIKHWLINNLVRKDFYRQTVYLEQKKQLEIKENGSYTENGNKMLTIRSRRLGKDRLGQVRIGKDTNTTEPSSGNEFINLFKEINPTYQHLFSRNNQRDACNRLLKLRSLEEWGKVIKFISSRRSDRFCPRISTPIQLEQKYADLETYAQGLKETNKSRLII